MTLFQNAVCRAQDGLWKTFRIPPDCPPTPKPNYRSYAHINGDRVYDQTILSPFGAAGRQAANGAGCCLGSGAADNCQSGSAIAPGFNPARYGLRQLTPEELAAQGNLPASVGGYGKSYYPASGLPAQGFPGADVDIEYVTILKVAIPGAKGDVPVQFTRAHKFFALASVDIGHFTDSLYFHFNPIGKSYPGGAAIQPDGTENWLPWPKRGIANGLDSPWIRLCTPIDTFYLDIGQESGGGNYFLTIAGSSSIMDYNMVGA